MAYIKIFTIFYLIYISVAFPTNNVDIITEPKPGQEYVYVQSLGSGARPIARKDKITEQERPFETAHKLPPSLTFIRNNEEDENVKTKPQKREAKPGDGPAPAPAGAIKLDVQKLLEKYKTELKISSTTPKIKSTASTTTKKSRRNGNRRIKKEAVPENESLIPATSPSPVLTTAISAPKSVDTDDIPLVASGSEKQRSRIQIKKGPNGQEYEYEYVYYYYDDDEEDNKNTKQTVSNSHDGPARKSAAPEVNEVLPTNKGSKTRSRQLGEEETVNEERLPANTRFPPRSRNLNTTPLPEEESKSVVTTSRGRGRGRPTTETAPVSGETDNVSDETQGSRGRTRANVRRPSLELVDNASFNTHSNSAGAEHHGPSFPTDLPAGPDEVKVEEPRQPAPVNESVEEGSVTSSADDVTTAMSPMDKVALDLYAILQGTQKLSGEDSDNNSSTQDTDEADVTTLETVTEPIVETTTPTTTTTTTTTTTPAPTTTTTTTTEAPLGKGRYRGRGNIGRKTTKSHEPSSTEASSSEAKPKNKFNRPSFGNKRGHHARTTPEPASEQEVSKEESKPVSHSRPTLSRSRFGASRPRGRTTATPSEENDSSSTSAPAAHRPSLPRNRPSFNNLRSRGRTTAAPTENASEGEDSSSPETASTTTKPRRISSGSGVRPLRPGPRINLASRGRGAATSTTEAPPAEDHVTGDDEPQSISEESEEKTQETSAAPTDNSPLGRLRNKNRPNIQVRPKAAASAPVQVRRVNPLLARRRPGQTTEASSSEVPVDSVVTEAVSVEEEAETEASASSSTTTTEEPRGLNKLLAGRRRLAVRQPGTNH